MACNQFSLPCEACESILLPRRRVLVGLACLLLGLCAWLFLQPAKPNVAPVIPIGHGRVKPHIIIVETRVFVLAPDGGLWCWGSGIWRSSEYYWMAPQRIGKESDWLGVAAGHAHVIALKSNGTIWQWNGYPFDNILTPKQLSADTNWVAIAAGLTHSLALKSDGTLWAWGANDEGQLGDGTTTRRTVPVRIGRGTNWTAIAASALNSLGLQRDGSLWIWGGGYSTNPPPVAPVRFGTGTNWTSVYSAKYGFAASQRDGTCWAGGFYSESLPWGLAASRPIRNGRLGWFKALAGLNPVAISHSCSLGMKKDGTLWDSGANSQGELGDGTYEARIDPVQIGHRHDWLSFAINERSSVGLCNDGSVWAWGIRRDKEPRLTPRWKEFLARWGQKLGVLFLLRFEWSLQAESIRSPSPELVLQFKLGDNRRISFVPGGTPVSRDPKPQR